MNLMWLTHNHKAIMLLHLYSDERKIAGVKVYESGNVLVNDRIINHIRGQINVLSQLPRDKLLQQLKVIIPQFGKLYRTYNKNTCKVLGTYPIISI